MVVTMLMACTIRRWALYGGGGGGRRGGRDRRPSVATEMMMMMVGHRSSWPGRGMVAIRYGRAGVLKGHSTTGRRVKGRFSGHEILDGLNEVERPDVVWMSDTAQTITRIATVAGMRDRPWCGGRHGIWSTGREGDGRLGEQSGISIEEGQLLRSQWMLKGGVPWRKGLKGRRRDDLVVGLSLGDGRRLCIRGQASWRWWW